MVRQEDQDYGNVPGHKRIGWKVARDAVGALCRLGKFQVLDCVPPAPGFCAQQDIQALQHGDVVGQAAIKTRRGLRNASFTLVSMK